jgi:hypothetical protein
MPVCVKYLRLWCVDPSMLFLGQKAQGEVYSRKSCELEFLQRIRNEIVSTERG